MMKHNKITIYITLAVTVIIVLIIPSSESFLNPLQVKVHHASNHYHTSNHLEQRRTSCTTTKSSKSEENTSNSSSNSGSSGSSGSNDDEQIFEQNMDNLENEQTDIMKELAWRSMKVNLEEANDRRFQKRLKSRPWKLPYDDARKWVQANLGVDTKEEFDDFVANGNLRTPYIPKQPEKYYTVSGTWISWNHFLKEKPV